MLLLVLLLLLVLMVLLLRLLVLLMLLGKPTDYNDRQGNPTVVDVFGDWHSY